jgi:hypothetical protein
MRMQTLNAVDVRENIDGWTYEEEIVGTGRDMCIFNRPKENFYTNNAQCPSKHPVFQILRRWSWKWLLYYGIQAVALDICQL